VTESPLPHPPAAPPSERRGLPWTGLVVLLVVGAIVYATAVVGHRAATLDGLVSVFEQQRDQYIVGVCHPEPLLARVPGWAENLRATCRDHEPQWGTEAPAQEAMASTALPSSSSGGLIVALGHILRTFNPVVLLEIFVALTVAFFVLLGVRGGETPVEKFLARLGGPLRTRFIRTAKRAAIAGLVLGGASLVAGSWASELREEKRICHETAVSYGYLLGIDGRCERLQHELVDARQRRDAAVDARARCDVVMASTEARLSANASIEQAAGALETSLRDEQDAKTKVVLDAVHGSFTALAQELGLLRVETEALRNEAAREKTVAELAGTVATKAALETLQRESAKEAALDALAAGVAKQAAMEVLLRDVARQSALDTVEAKLKTLDELKGRSCAQRGDLEPLEKLLRDLPRPPPPPPPPPVAATKGP
jgi:hypothetical protein